MKLRLIFVRHATWEVLSRGKGLDEPGRESIRSLAAKLKQDLKIFPNKIFVGIQPRSIESAIILSEEFELGEDPEPMIQLDEGHGGQFVKFHMKKLPDDLKTVLCVSHANTISNEAQALGRENGVNLKNGAALIVEFDGENWSEANNPRYQIVEP